MDFKNKNPKKILIINTFGIGDVLFTMPFVENLMVNFPNAEIAYLGNRRVEPLLRGYPKIKKVFIYDRDDFQAVNKRSKLKFFKKIFSFLKEVKNEQFDIVFDFSLNSTINFLTMLVGIPERVGFNYRDRSPFLTVKFHFEGFERKHVVEYYFDLLEYLGLEVTVRKLQFPVNPQDCQWVDQFLKRAGRDPGKRLVGVIPGAGASWGAQSRYRRWAPEKYKKLLDKLIDKFSLQIILMGDQREADLCAQVIPERDKSVIHAYGKTSVGQLLALLSRCELIILNDGGPFHMAVAVGVKTVSIFGPVDEVVYGPYGDFTKHVVVKKDIACRPCYRNFRMTACDHISCLQQIEVEDVLRKVESLL